MNSNENSFVSHSITIKDRRTSEISGIDDILSFNDSEISLHSSLGNLIIEGEDLKLGDFSSGNGTLSVCGKINGILYLEDSGKSRSTKKKAFR